MLVDDHELVRLGLRTILAAYPDLEVVGEASSVATAVEAISRITPDVILLDMRLKDGTGFDICRQLDQLKIKSRILVLTSFSNDEVLMKAIEAGVDGFILKEVDSKSLVAAIRKVGAGESALDPATTRLLMNKIQKISSRADEPMSQLSQQELKVLEQVASGKTNKEIAAELQLSDKTVKNYLANLMGKLMISRRAEAASIYTQWKQNDRH